MFGDQQCSTRFQKGRIPHNQSNLLDLVQVGQMFGRWRVVSSNLTREGGHRKLLVRCGCGFEVLRNYDSLVSGKSTQCNSCSDQDRKLYTKEQYRIAKNHTSMMARCYNRRHPSYKDYGARGIRVQKELQEKAKFIEYVESLPHNGNELDRIDNNKGYEIGNLRWVTRQEQTRNTRRNKYVVWQDKRMVLADFIREYTSISDSYARRLIREGRSLEYITDNYPRV